jgi:hypothetical protein
MEKPVFDPNTPPGEERKSSSYWIQPLFVFVQFIALMSMVGLHLYSRSQINQLRKELSAVRAGSAAFDQSNFQLLELKAYPNCKYDQVMAGLDAMGFRPATYDEFITWNRYLSFEEREQLSSHVMTVFSNQSIVAFDYLSTLCIDEWGRGRMDRYGLDNPTFPRPPLLLIVRKDAPKPPVVEKSVASTSFTESVSIGDVMRKWSSFYYRHFGVQIINFTDLEIPPKPEGDYRLVVVLSGITPNKAYAACEKLFKCWKSRENLDDGFENDVRKAEGHPYAVWLYAGPEEKAPFVDRNSRPTLLERMLLEIQVWEQTGRHLNKRTLTACDSSQYPNGYAPAVYWDDRYGMVVN